MKYATYQSYKFSGTDWISDIPGNWECWRLKDCGSLLAGAGFPHEYQGLEDEELPFYKVGDLSQSLDGRHMASGEHTISRKTAYMLRAKVIPPSAIVYAKIGAALLLNRRRITVKNCCIDNNMTAFIPNPRILSTAWAHYWLSTLDFGEFTNPGAVPSLSEGYQATLPIALPPLDEQQTIARFLDAKTAQIDALVAQKRQLIAKLKEKRQALIARTVTRGLPPEAAKAAGLEPNPQMKDSGVDWLGEIPAHWGEDKVARLFRAMKGRNAAQLTKEYCATIEGEYPVYSGQTENDGVMSSIDEFEFDTGEDGYLFSTTVGAKAMSLMHLKGRFSLSQNCMVIAPMTDKVQVRFYYYHLQPLFQFERGLIPEHMQASFRMEDLYQYRVAIPPKAEQRAIADYLDQMCATVDDLLAATESAIVKLNEYRQALITSAVTGKIDVRNFAPTHIEET